MTTSTITRLSAVQKALSESGIAKDQNNQQQRYKYRGIDQLMNTLAPILAANELLILSSTTSHTIEPLVKGVRHIVSVDFTIVGPEGTLGPFSSMGECVDFGDKGLNKAIGAAYKYWVFTSLCVPTEATEDADAVSPEAHSLEPKVTTAHAKQLGEMVSEAGADMDKLLKYYDVPAIAELTSSQAESLANTLAHRIAQSKAAEMQSDTIDDQKDMG